MQKADRALTGCSTHQATIGGLLFSLLFCSCLLWCAYQLLLLAEIIPRPGLDPHTQLEKSYNNMQKISGAQGQYYKESAAILGQGQYAQFLAHLWITPDHQGKQIHLDLISRRLALATGRKKTLHGYYFKDVHYRSDGKQKVKLDYTRQWTMAALPLTFSKNGTKVLLADESGKIFSKNFKKLPSHYPLHPTRNGWREVTGNKTL